MWQSAKLPVRCTWIFGSILFIFLKNENQTNLVGRGKGVVVLGAEVSRPRVEHLDHLSAAVDLYCGFVDKSLTIM